MLNEEQYKKIKEIVDRESTDEIPSYKIKLIDEELDNYIKETNSPDEYKLLLYTCRIKNIIDNYVLNLPDYSRRRFTYCSGIDYPIARTLRNVDDNYKKMVSKINICNVENGIERIEEEIRNDTSLTHYKKGKKLTYKKQS